MLSTNTLLDLKTIAAARPKETIQLTRIQLAFSEDGNRLYVLPIARDVSNQNTHSQDLLELRNWANKNNVDVYQSMIVLPLGGVDPQVIAALTSECSVFSKHVLATNFMDRKTKLVASSNRDLVLLKEGPQLTSFKTDSKAVEQFARKTPAECDLTTLAEVLGGASVNLEKYKHLIKTAILDDLCVGPGMSRGRGTIRFSLYWKAESKNFILSHISEDKSEVNEVFVIGLSGNIIEYRGTNVPVTRQIDNSHYVNALKVLVAMYQS